MIPLLPFCRTFRAVTKMLILGKYQPSSAQYSTVLTVKPTHIFIAKARERCLLGRSPSFCCR